MSRFPRCLRGICALAILVALAGCAADYQMTINQENFMTFEHEFTDQAAANARNRADRTCTDRKLAAVKLTSNCTLNKCFTSYQCMEKEDAAVYGSAPPAPQR